MSAAGLKKIETLNEEELRIFLQNNGMDASIKYFDVKELNGKTFLNLANPEPTGWKNLVPIFELQKVRTFIEEVKENPEKFLTHIEEPLPQQNLFSFFEDSKQKISNVRDVEQQEENDDLAELKEELKMMLEGTERDNHSIKLPEPLTMKIGVNSIESNVIRGINEATNKFVGPGEVSQSPKTNTNAAAATNYRKIKSKYYLDMNRKQAEKFLRTCYLDGTYLFRPSSQHYCALSVLFENEIHHFPIESVDGYRLELVTVGENLQFNTLDEIVKYLKLHPALRIAELKKTIRLSNPFLQSM